MKTTSVAARRIGRIVAGAVSIATLGLWLAACNNGQGGFSGAVGGTPNNPPEAVFKILGTSGTGFTATVSDKRSSWQLQGNVPLSVTIVNDILPARMVATKLAGDNSLLSLQISKGGQIVDLSSTTAPFGNVSVQTGGKLKTLAPPASPDLRIFVTSPAGEHFNGLIEDKATSFVVDDRAPAIFMFDTPNGKVDGEFNQIQNFGPFTVNMTLDGNVVATVTGGPSVTIVEP